MEGQTRYQYGRHRIRQSSVCHRTIFGKQKRGGKSSCLSGLFIHPRIHPRIHPIRDLSIILDRSTEEKKKEDTRNKHGITANNRKLSPSFVIVVNIVCEECGRMGKNVHKRVLHGLMNVGRNRTLDLVVLLFVESVVNFMVFDNALIQDTVLYGSVMHAGRGG